MRRSIARWCSKIDLDGVPSKYYPRFRPRRLVMPVDPSDVHADRRQPSPLYQVYKAQTRRRRQAERRGAVQLGTVPSERSVGDVYRLMLDACAAQHLFSEAAITPVAVRELERLVKAQEKLDATETAAASPSVNTAALRDNNEEEEEVEAAAVSVIASPLYALAFQTKSRNTSSDHGASTSPSSSSPPATPASRPDTAHTLSVREVDMLWAMLDHTPLSSPVHGALALRGDALVRTTLLELAYSGYPRLRSKHVQQLLHETTGLLPCGRAAIRLGFAEHCGVEGDIAMWRELNTLSERLRIARKQATAHLQRMEKGVAAQRRWYWRGVLRSASGRLKLFPVHREELQPRLEWVRSSLFAFIAFAEVAEQSGDTQVRVKPLIYQLFASQLARHVRRRQLLDAAEEIAARRSAERAVAATGDTQTKDGQDVTKQRTQTAAAVNADRVAAELTRVKARSLDEEEVLEGRTHPMNRRADRTREQYESSGGAHGTQMLRDEALGRHEETFARLAPPLLLHALEATSVNAFKEAQLILRYAPQIAEPLRRSPIDVDQAVRRVVEVQETNNYAALHHAQQYRQVEYTVCRLYAGKFCLGEGKGETLMSAMQDASMEMLFRYYCGTSTAAQASSMEESSVNVKTRKEPSRAGTCGVDGQRAKADDDGIPAARIRPAKTEEEIVL